jgi:hypothetical protein
VQPINKLLVVYSTLLTAALAVSLLTHASAVASLQSIDVLDVKRINLREEDGTLRMVIANTKRFPGIIFHGHERPHPDRRTAGILFFNNEGTENGGLIFGGTKSGNKVDTYAHLSFDQYDQDQVLTVSQNESDGERTAGINILDRPSSPLDFGLIDRIHAIPEGAARQQELDRARTGGKFGFTRLTVGKTADHASTVKLMDDRGRARLVLKVTAGGQAAIEFLDDTGKVVRSFTGTSGPPE